MRSLNANAPKPPTSSANTAARRVKNGKLKANETPPTHNNRSLASGGVRYHCGLLETSTSKGGRGQNREEEEKYATIGNLDYYRKNLGLS
jgi:hypothetical protein